MPRKSRARYSYQIIRGIVVVSDHGNTPSVTNDAENVLAELSGLVQDFKRHPVIYQGTDSQWTELRKDDSDKFLGFRVLHTQSLDDALAAVK